MFIGRTDAEDETPIFWQLTGTDPLEKTDSLEKTLMLGKIEGQEKKGATDYELVGSHHQLNGNEFEQTPGYCEGQ